ncbi:hypothetical protein CYMTET_38209 [Cymbomonas tetramitiformis]|uniref:Cupin type-1 domain-containing protein n=1 Tax=Cymbomonas tetramitiformis TaxID=36881 RepID=A0AAE0CEP2_9CHLO|nr:hypothetical protein CYMTET_38209 [Cymbomonas tetramitiformis]
MRAPNVFASKGLPNAVLVLLLLTFLVSSGADTRKQFADDSTHLSNVHSSKPINDVFGIPLSTYPAHADRRGGSLTFLWSSGDAPNPLFNAEMNFALYEGIAGNIRELHWHPDASEWAFVLSGRCFATMLDPSGKVANGVLNFGDVWYFPRNWAHAIQAGKPGCRAVLVFNSPEWVPSNDFGLSQLLTRFPPSQGATSFGFSDAASAAAQQRQLMSVAGDNDPILLSMGPVPDEVWPIESSAQSAHNPIWPFLKMQPKQNYSGNVVQQLFQESFTFAADLSGEWDVMQPGAVRSAHWHANAGEFQYVVTGSLHVTVVSFGGNSQELNLGAGDLGWAPVGFPHSYECASANHCEVLLAWNTGNLETFELFPLLQFSPPTVLASNLNMTLKRFQKLVPAELFSAGRITR